MNDRAGHSRQSLHLGAAYHAPFLDDAVQNFAVEPDGAIEILHRQSDVIEAAHRAPSRGRGRSRANISSSVSRRLMSVHRLPVTSTVAGRVRALKLLAAASWYAP